ncbi:DUF1177 domain-containing protein [Burkholderia pseudomultivorans]|uniref:DUF1177 domain-containing protein n=1 Tax=Burkholderia pseudomultivorans TaxID=1207504 RepID=UPI0001FD7860|nr:DUF1177 domain-containing protein [Burkholderia pseudomultivorans]EGD00764.1 hypothetical protein B1M_29945 [Burkholderia sp. TJI49]KVC19833.1 hypothetical protein WS55_23280 [Burkholderia pseudomultivorans]KVC32184.1 hypothetical protein WS56_14885 [Burkholderia pseudomultivorans]KVC53685.1 hypothetical protein WS58_33105 [Burkholderia pseudomultivorans]MDS0792659.1 DUF1177 domain-containing protein [Burkholderia pseudomultivorans]
MALKQTLVIFDALDGATVNGQDIAALFEPYAAHGVTAEVTTVNNEPPEDPTKTTDFIRITIPGARGKTAGGDARTLGIVGRNGAIGARPAKFGMVSDADGPIGSLAAALKLAQMKANGDVLPGDVIVTTHLSTDVSMSENNGVPFMGMPVSSATMNRYEVTPDMDAILSLDASKGNRIVKQRGFALSPTAMQGYILRMAPDLVAIMESTTGMPAVTFPISLQDISPYDNGLSHFNSIMQPHVGTDKPVVGVALTARSVVGGSDSSASHEIDLAEAVRFSVEVAKRFTAGACEFYDANEWRKIRSMYPDLRVFQGYGNAA